MFCRSSYAISQLWSRPFHQMQAPQAVRPNATSARFSSHVRQARRNLNKPVKPSKPNPNAMVRLSKRMSELGICSRREAAKILKDTTDAKGLMLCEQAIYLRGEAVTAGTGVKVRHDEQMIEIRSFDEIKDKAAEAPASFVPYDKMPWEKIRDDTIVLNKPVGYVSGQEEHQHVPAVRLLTPSNFHVDLNGSIKSKEEVIYESAFRFTKKKWDGFDLGNSSLPKHIRQQLRAESSGADDPKDGVVQEEVTLSGYAPAGRLDIDSTGLIIFTRAGIMARKLIAPDSKITKEYIVKVEPVVQPTAHELRQGLNKLPPTTHNLEALLRGGRVLHNDTKPLKPLVKAEWLDGNTLRLVLNEGKKRQIRRMCREIIGWHVVSLVRTRIGPITLGDMPEGKWRSLSEDEVRDLFNWGNRNKMGRGDLNVSTVDGYNRM